MNPEFHTEEMVSANTRASQRESMESPFLRFARERARRRCVTTQRRAFFTEAGFYRLGEVPQVNEIHS